MRPRLLIADDHTLLLDGLRVMLEAEFELAGVVKDGHALLAGAAKMKPDLILLDISMPALNGIDAARQRSKIAPLSKLIFLTMHGNTDYVTEAFRIGASGYVLKRDLRRGLLCCWATGGKKARRRREGVFGRMQGADEKS